MPKLGDFSMQSISGETIPLATYEGQVCLIVNLASQ